MTKVIDSLPTEAGRLGAARDVRILDCFMYFNEFDHLRLRMEELGDVVDGFVLVEGTHSHSGQRKAVWASDDTRRLPTSGPPLITHVADLSGFRGRDRWAREHAQRDALLEALERLPCAPDDVILLSDADEIPRASSLPAVLEMLRHHRVAVLEQTLHRYYLNNVTVARDHLRGWCGTVAIRYDDLRRTTPSRVRFEWCAGGQLSRYASPRQRRVMVPDAGWHFTYMGGRDSVAYKRQNFAHEEGDDPALPRIGGGLERAPAGAGPQDCRVFGGACPCGCTWGDLPQAYAGPDFSISDLDVPSHVRTHPEEFVHWLRPSAEEATLVDARSLELVEVTVIRTEADLGWTLDEIASGRAVSGLTLLDLRPGRHDPPDLGNSEARWYAFPSATPGSALNRFLLPHRARLVRRWFPRAPRPLPPLSLAALRQHGGYNARLPAGEEWALRWQLETTGRHAWLWGAINTYWEPAPRGSPQWEAQMYVCALVVMGQLAPPRPSRIASVPWRLWMAKERLLARQLRTAWRELRGRSA